MPNIAYAMWVMDTLMVRVERFRRWDSRDGNITDTAGPIDTENSKNVRSLQQSELATMRALETLVFGPSTFASLLTTATCTRNLLLRTLCFRLAARVLRFVRESHPAASPNLTVTGTTEIPLLLRMVHQLKYLTIVKSHGIGVLFASRHRREAGML